MPAHRKSPTPAKRWSTILSTPTAPKAVGTVDLPADLSPYNSFYRYYCGDMGYYGGYYFSYGQSTASVSDGIAFLIQNATYAPKTVTLSDGRHHDPIQLRLRTQNLAFLDLRNPAKPAISEQRSRCLGPTSGSVDSASLVADSMAPRASTSATARSRQLCRCANPGDAVSVRELRATLGAPQRGVARRGRHQHSRLPHANLGRGQRRTAVADPGRCLRDQAGGHLLAVGGQRQPESPARGHGERQARRRAPGYPNLRRCFPEVDGLRRRPDLYDHLEFSLLLWLLHERR
jgi:hypothetical protein